MLSSLLTLLDSAAWCEQQLEFSSAVFSSTYGSEIAARCIDGDFSSGCHSGCSVNGAEIWMRLQLKGTAEINRLVIYPSHVDAVNSEGNFRRPAGARIFLVKVNKKTSRTKDLK